MGLEFKIPKGDLIMEGYLDPYFGGIHAIAKEEGRWIGSADPRRDGLSLEVGEQEVHNE